MVENAMPASTARASSRRTPIAVRAKAAAVAASALAPTNHACIAPVQLTTWKPNASTASSGASAATTASVTGRAVLRPTL